MITIGYIWALLLAVSTFIHVEGSESGDASCPTYNNMATCWRLSASHCLCLMDATYNKDFQGGSNFCSELKISDSSEIPDLVSIHSPQENKILYEKIQNLTVDAWIGLKYEEGTFYWKDGTPTDYFNWINGTPSSKYFSCGRMKRETGTWEIEDGCDEPFCAAACGVKYEFTTSTTAFPETTEGPSQSPPDPNNTGTVVVVIVIAVVVLVGALAAGVLFIRSRRKGDQEEGTKLLSLPTDYDEL